MKAALREAMAEAHGSAVSCPSCKVDFDDFRDPHEARYYAAQHNELHAHGQCLGAIVVDVDRAANEQTAPEAAEAAQLQPAATDAGAVDEDGW